MKKLCFDAGHYKHYNQSKVFKPYFEGDKMWELHLLVKAYLEKNYNVEIKTTRSSLNKDLELYNRGYLSKGYDGFYSFHSNACDDEKVDRVVIIRSLGEKSLNNYCIQLGEGIKSIMGLRDKSQVYEKDNGRGGEWYGVLRGAKAGGVKNRFIIEHSFHTNKKSAMWLYDSKNLEMLAKVEGDIIAKYHKLEKKNKIPKMIKIIEDVNFRYKNEFSNDFIKGIAKKGEVFTVIDRVKSNTNTDMYLLKSGYYITTSNRYIEEYK